MMMVIYRPHRGGLVESLREAQTFDSVESMKESIVEEWESVFHYPMFGIEDIVLNDDKPGVNDERCGWEDTRYVCVKRMGNEIYSHPQCIGMWATQFPRG